MIGVLPPEAVQLNTVPADEKPVIVRLVADVGGTPDAVVAVMTADVTEPAGSVATTSRSYSVAGCSEGIVTDVLPVGEPAFDQEPDIFWLAEMGSVVEKSQNPFRKHDKTNV